MKTIESHRIRVVVIGLVILLEAVSAHAGYGTISAVQRVSFAVTSLADSGAGTLRDAIVKANNNPGLDRIEFDPSLTNQHVIKPLTPLPPITDPVFLEGTTHPDGRVELDGSSMSGQGAGLMCSGPASVIKGLSSHSFSSGGVYLTGTGAVQNRLENNFIGTDFSGTVALGGGRVGVQSDPAPRAEYC